MAKAPKPVLGQYTLHFMSPKGEVWEAAMEVPDHHVPMDVAADLMRALTADMARDSK